ncbi:MAG: hypothetical protein Q4C43_07960 [Prevotella sp.]|nr:hypothetical protein [Prevotella sp.]MDO4934348.1 hypothetical protein [Prevotella sp.]
MNNHLDSSKWSENVILVDADYVDSVAFDLTVNFERMIGRRIPKADMARWIDCVALDGGIREGSHETQVVLIHGKRRTQMENFAPGDYAGELDGKAFRDTLGEFQLSALPVEDDVTTAANLFIESLEVISNSKEVKRIMVIPDAEKIYDRVRETLRRVDDEEKRITVFAMQPMTGGNFRQEILGYSLMQALGIRADEIG